MRIKRIETAHVRGGETFRPNKAMLQLIGLIKTNPMKTARQLAIIATNQHMKHLIPPHKNNGGTVPEKSMRQYLKDLGSIDVNLRIVKTGAYEKFLYDDQRLYINPETGFLIDGRDSEEMDQPVKALDPEDEFLELVTEKRLYEEIANVFMSA